MSGLLIKWEEMSLSNRPLIGVGEYEGQLVFFSLANTSGDDYNLYSMSNDSLEIVTQEHDRFVREVGHIRDYGELFSIQTHGNVQSFKRGYNPEDLDLKLITSIGYSRIINKFPNVRVPSASDEPSQHQGDSI